MRHVPNTLTKARMILIPTYLVFLYHALFYPSNGNFWLGFGWLVALGLTDLIDGWLAKTFGWQTEFGKKWDPIADKLLFWSSIPLLWAWMLSTAASSTNVLAGMLIISALSAFVLQHGQLDVVSTCLRSAKVESAKQLGRIKFNLDLLAVAMTIIAARLIEQGRIGNLEALVVITLTLGAATLLAQVNVRQRQAALLVS